MTASATPLGLIAAGDAVEAAIRLLESFCATRPRCPRARSRRREGAEQFDAISDLSLPLVPAISGIQTLDRAYAGMSGQPRDAAIGAHRLRDGSLACGLGLAFGHADAASLEQLAMPQLPPAHSGLRTAPGRALLAIGLTPDTLRPLSPKPNGSALSYAPTIRAATLSPAPARRFVLPRISPRGHGPAYRRISRAASRRRLHDPCLRLRQRLRACHACRVDRRRHAGWLRVGR